MERIILWDLISDIGPVDSVDLNILKSSLLAHVEREAGANA